MKGIVCNLMDRLSTYTSGDGSSGLKDSTDSEENVFEIFNEHVKGVIGAKTTMSTGDILSLHVSLIRFAMQCARSPEDQIKYANSVMAFCADFLEKSVGGPVDDASAELLVSLVEAVISALLMRVLQPETERFEDLLQFLKWPQRKTIAVRLVRGIVDAPVPVEISDPTLVDRLLKFIEPLVKDAPDAPATEVEAAKEEFEEEQRLVAQLIHLFRNDDPVRASVRACEPARACRWWRPPQPASPPIRALRLLCLVCGPGGGGCRRRPLCDVCRHGWHPVRQL